MERFCVFICIMHFHRSMLFTNMGMESVFREYGSIVTYLLRCAIYIRVTYQFNLRISFTVKRFLNYKHWNETVSYHIISIIVPVLSSSFQSPHQP